MYYFNYLLFGIEILIYMRNKIYGSEKYLNIILNYISNILLKQQFP